MPAINKYVFSKEAVMTHFMNGDLSRALAMLHGERAPGCAVIRARSYLRLDDSDRARANYLDGLSYSNDWRERVELELGLANFEPDSSLETILRKCLAVAVERSDPLLEAECYIAMLTQEVAFKGTDSLFSHVLEALQRSESTPVRPEQSWYWYEPSLLRARAHALRSYAMAARGEIENEEQALLQAVLAGRLSVRRDLMFDATNIGQLAFFLRHFDRPVIRHLVEMFSEDERMKDIVGLPIFRHYFTRARLVNSWVFASDPEQWRDIPSANPTILAQLLLAMDRVLLGPADGQPAFERDVANLLNLAGRKEWLTDLEKTDDVFMLCATLAPYDPERARSLNYATPKSLSALHQKLSTEHRDLNHDFAKGVLAKASGSFDEADKYLRSALVRWRKYGMRAYAAIAGLELHTISGSESDLTDAESVIADFPSTAFSKRLNKSIRRSVGARQKSDFAHLRYQ